MSEYEDRLKEDPTGVKAAREADEALESAVKKAIGGFGQVNDALEAGKKHSWTLLVAIGVIGGFLVKTTLFYAEYSRNAETSKEFRETTIAQLAALKDTQDKAERANQEFKYAQIVTNNRLTDIADDSKRRLGLLEDRK